MGSLSARLARLERAANEAMWQRAAADLATDHDLPLAEVLADAKRRTARLLRHPAPRRADGQIDCRRWYRGEARAMAADSGGDLADALRRADELAAKAEAGQRQRRAARQAMRR
jgi:hypothetical protein